MKGPTWLSVVPDFDIIDGVSIDYMHAVLLGVCRLLLRLWLQSCNHNELCYIGNQSSLLDKRLCAIKPPREIQRTPRSIETSLKYWKGMYNECIFMYNYIYIYIYIVIFIAHELRAWFIHYSPAVLHNILPNDYYQHYLLLVEGIYLLLKSEVTETDLHQSLRLLQHYCFLFASFYGKNYVNKSLILQR